MARLSLGLITILVLGGTAALAAHSHTNCSSSDKQNFYCRLTYNVDLQTLDQLNSNGISTHVLHMEPAGDNAFLNFMLDNNSTASCHGKAAVTSARGHNANMDYGHYHAQCARSLRHKTLMGVGCLVRQGKDVAYTDVSLDDIALMCSVIPNLASQFGDLCEHGLRMSGNRDRVARMSIETTASIMDEMFSSPRLSANLMKSSFLQTSDSNGIRSQTKPLFNFFKVLGAVLKHNRCVPSRKVWKTELHITKLQQWKNLGCLNADADTTQINYMLEQLLKAEHLRIWANLDNLEGWDQRNDNMVFHHKNDEPLTAIPASYTDTKLAVEEVWHVFQSWAGLESLQNDPSAHMARYGSSCFWVSKDAVVNSHNEGGPYFDESRQSWVMLAIENKNPVVNAPINIEYSEVWGQYPVLEGTPRLLNTYGMPTCWKSAKIVRFEHLSLPCILSKNKNELTVTMDESSGYHATDVACLTQDPDEAGKYLNRCTFVEAVGHIRDKAFNRTYTEASFTLKGFTGYFATQSANGFDKIEVSDTGGPEDPWYSSYTKRLSNSFETIGIAAAAMFGAAVFVFVLCLALGWKTFMIFWAPVLHVSRGLFQGIGTVTVGFFLLLISVSEATGPAQKDPEDPTKTLNGSMEIFAIKRKKNVTLIRAGGVTTVLIFLVLFIAPAKADCVALTASSSMNKKELKCTEYADYMVTHEGQQAEVSVSSIKSWQTSSPNFETYVYPETVCVHEACGERNPPDCTAEQGLPAGRTDYSIMRHTSFLFFSHWWAETLYNAACSKVPPAAYDTVMSTKVSGPASELLLNGGKRDHVALGNGIIHVMEESLDRRDTQVYIMRQKGELKVKAAKPDGRHVEVGSGKGPVKNLMLNPSQVKDCKETAALDFITPPFPVSLDVCAPGDSNPRHFVKYQPESVGQALDSTIDMDVKFALDGDTDCFHECTTDVKKIKAGEKSCDKTDTANGGWTAGAKSYKHCGPVGVNVDIVAKKPSRTGTFKMIVPYAAEVTASTCGWRSLSLKFVTRGNRTLLEVKGDAQHDLHSTVVLCNGTQTSMIKIKCKTASYPIPNQGGIIECATPYSGSYLSTSGHSKPTFAHNVKNITGSELVSKFTAHTPPEEDPGFFTVVGSWIYGNVALGFAFIFDKTCAEDFMDGHWSKCSWVTWLSTAIWVICVVGGAIMAFVIYSKERSRGERLLKNVLKKTDGITPPKDGHETEVDVDNDAVHRAAMAAAPVVRDSAKALDEWRRNYRR